jgi:hypothetical protein
VNDLIRVKTIRFNHLLKARSAGNLNDEHDDAGSHYGPVHYGEDAGWIIIL